MNKLLLLLVFIFVIGVVFIFMIGVSHFHTKEAEKGYCPFGICMGDDPGTLYSDNKIVNSLLSDDFDPIIFSKLPITPKFLNRFYDDNEDINSLQNTDINKHDNVEYLANISTDTSICSVIISITLGDETIEIPPYNEKNEDVLKEVIEYIKKETNHGDYEVTEKGNQVFQIWKGKAVERLKNIFQIGIAHSKINYRHISNIGWIIIEYRFDNYKLCEENN